MKVINESRPFNAGDEISHLRRDERGNALGWIRVRVSSWRPGIDVHALDTRGRSHVIPWHVAEQRKVTR